MSTTFLNRVSDTALTQLTQIHTNSGTLSRLTLSQAVKVQRQEVKRKPASRRFWSRAAWLTSTALAVSAVAAFQPWKSLDATPAAETSLVETLRTVRVDYPTPASTSNVMLPATFRPWQTTELHSRVSGYLATWHRELGSTVKAGDLLAVLETPELDQELAEGQALASEASAAVIQAQAERIEAEADLNTAEAQLLRAHAEAELARTQLIRKERLLTKQVIAQEEYDISLKERDARIADVAAAKADLRRRQTNLQTRAAIIEARQATSKSRNSNVERLQELQRFKRIVAPFSGTVTRRTAEVGMLVTAGKESLFVIEDMSRVRVQINVPQTYALQTVPGVEAIINVPESSVKSVRGTITRVAKSVESTNRTMLAEIEIENSTLRLQPGSYAQVALNTPQNGALWTIPTNTLSMRVDGPHIAVVNEGDQIAMRKVHLGRDLGNRVVVVDGIQGSERLVVNPGDDLINGLQIQVAPTESNTEVAKR
jgi:multidrug efflux pump subunit AcrA (membrane-fusion protein)